MRSQVATPKAPDFDRNSRPLGVLDPQIDLAWTSLVRTAIDHTKTPNLSKSEVSRFSLCRELPGCGGSKLRNPLAISGVSKDLRIDSVGRLHPHVLALFVAPNPRLTSPLEGGLPAPVLQLLGSRLQGDRAVVVKVQR